MIIDEKLFNFLCFIAFISLIFIFALYAVFELAYNIAKKIKDSLPVTLEEIKK